MAAGSDSDDVTIISRPKQPTTSPATTNGNNTSKRHHFLSVKDKSRKQRKLDQTQSSPRRHPLAYLDVDLDPDSDHSSSALPSPLFNNDDADATATRPNGHAQDALLPELRSPNEQQQQPRTNGHDATILEIDPLMEADQEQQDKKPDVAAILDHHMNVEPAANGLHLSPPPPPPSPMEDPLNRPHLQKARLPFLKRTLEPPITTRQWAGQCRALHESLSSSAGFASSTTRINNPPTCKPFTRTSNPLIKFNFAYACVDHRLVQQQARRRAWFFDDACPWCCPQSGMERVDKVQVTNVPDLVAHLRQAHTDFDFEAKRAASQKAVTIYVRCRHDSESDSLPPPPAAAAAATAEPEASTSAAQPLEQAESFSSLPFEGLHISNGPSSSSIQDRKPPKRIPSAELLSSDEEHALVPWKGARAAAAAAAASAASSSLAAPPKRSPRKPAPPPATFMDLAMAHANKLQHAPSSKLPPAVHGQGMHYKPNVPPAWTGASTKSSSSSGTKKRVKQVYGTTKKPYLRGSDFGQLDPHDVVSDSEDDDGHRYHWESHYQQMRLADQPDIDTNVVFMQQAWFSTCRSMSDMHRSRPYDACSRLISTYATAIWERGARRELVEHLASMASWHTITPDQVEVLMQKFDRKAEEAAHAANAQQQGEDTTMDEPTQARLTMGSSSSKSPVMR